MAKKSATIHFPIETDFFCDEAENHDQSLKAVKNKKYFGHYCCCDFVLGLPCDKSSRFSIEIKIHNAKEPANFIVTSQTWKGCCEHCVDLTSISCDVDLIFRRELHGTAATEPFSRKVFT